MSTILNKDQFRKAPDSQRGGGAGDAALQLFLKQLASNGPTAFFQIPLRELQQGGVGGKRAALRLIENVIDKEDDDLSTKRQLVSALISKYGMLLISLAGLKGEGDLNNPKAKDYLEKGYGDLMTLLFSKKEFCNEMLRDIDCRYPNPKAPSFMPPDVAARLYLAQHPDQGFLILLKFHELKEAFEAAKSAMRFSDMRTAFVNQILINFPNFQKIPDSKLAQAIDDYLSV